MQTIYSTCNSWKLLSMPYFLPLSMKQQSLRQWYQATCCKESQSLLHLSLRYATFMSFTMYTRCHTSRIKQTLHPVSGAGHTISGGWEIQVSHSMSELVTPGQREMSHIYTCFAAAPPQQMWDQSKYKLWFFHTCRSSMFYTPKKLFPSFPYSTEIIQP